VSFGTGPAVNGMPLSALLRHRFGPLYLIIPDLTPEKKDGKQVGMHPAFPRAASY
jgi:hypothetical protein